MKSHTVLHEAFQYLVRKRNNRQVERQKTFAQQHRLDPSRTASMESRSLSRGSQDLGSLDIEEEECQYNHQRTHNPFPYLVGVGTPPPIEIEGFVLQARNEKATNQDNAETDLDNIVSSLAKNLNLNVLNDETVGENVEKDKKKKKSR